MAYRRVVPLMEWVALVVAAAACALFGTLCALGAVWMVLQRLGVLP